MNAGGTGSFMLNISARFAPFPPPIAMSFFPISESHTISLSSSLSDFGFSGALTTGAGVDWTAPSLGVGPNDWTKPFFFSFWKAMLSWAMDDNNPPIPAGLGPEGRGAGAEYEGAGADILGAGDEEP